MNEPLLYSSLTRISDLQAVPFEMQQRPKKSWASGDYVAVQIEALPGAKHLEAPGGRILELAVGDLVVGALGRRHATLEVTGRWEDVGSDGGMELLNAGGILGKCTSCSAVIAPPAKVRYRGHVTREGSKVVMKQFAPEVTSSSGVSLDRPSVMIIGTSMSAGKTATARAVIRRLRRMGRSVVAGKVTGAGRLRDILSMADSGAHAVYDFVDAGLPSTVCPASEYQPALDAVLERMNATPTECAVFELGASPLEPYNGSVAMERLESSVRLTILCASDPYAVVGLIHAFGRAPDLVSGIAANTLAGIGLVEKLTNVPCMNLLDPDVLPALDRLLIEKLPREKRHEAG